MDISQILNLTQKLVVTYRGVPVEIEYACEKITPTYQAQLKKLAEDEATTDSEVNSPDAKMLSELLISWDVTQGGQPYPPTFENLLIFSYPFLAALSRAILGDLVNPTHSSAAKS